MRIIIVSQSYSYGNGQGSFTVHLAESMAQRGHQVMVIKRAENMKSYSTSDNGIRLEHVEAVHISVIHPMSYITPLLSVHVKILYLVFIPAVDHILKYHLL